jgi:NADPH:quinone reductase
MAKLLKRGMGWSFAPTKLGERITKEIVELVRVGKVRPVIGAEVGFDELPAAMEAMANRQTVGRTIVRVE